MCTLLTIKRKYYVGDLLNKANRGSQNELR